MMVPIVTRRLYLSMFLLTEICFAQGKSIDAITSRGNTKVVEAAGVAVNEHVLLQIHATIRLNGTSITQHESVSFDDIEKRMDSSASSQQWIVSLDEVSMEASPSTSEEDPSLLEMEKVLALSWKADGSDMVAKSRDNENEDPSDKIVITGTTSLSLILPLAEDGSSTAMSEIGLEQQQQEQFRTLVIALWRHETDTGRRRCVSRRFAHVPRFKTTLDSNRQGSQNRRQFNSNALTEVHIVARIDDNKESLLESNASPKGSSTSKNKRNGDIRKGDGVPVQPPSSSYFRYFVAAILAAVMAAAFPIAVSYYRRRAEILPRLLLVLQNIKKALLVNARLLLFGPNFYNMDTENETEEDIYGFYPYVYEYEGNHYGYEEHNATLAQDENEGYSSVSGGHDAAVGNDNYEPPPLMERRIIQPLPDLGITFEAEMERITMDNLFLTQQQDSRDANQHEPAVLSQRQAQPPEQLFYPNNALGRSRYQSYPNQRLSSIFDDHSASWEDETRMRTNPIRHQALAEPLRLCLQADTAAATACFVYRVFLGRLNGETSPVGGLTTEAPYAADLAAEFALAIQNRLRAGALPACGDSLSHQPVPNRSNQLASGSGRIPLGLFLTVEQGRQLGTSGSSHQPSPDDSRQFLGHRDGRELHLSSPRRSPEYRSNRNNGDANEERMKSARGVKRPRQSEDRDNIIPSIQKDSEELTLSGERRFVSSAQSSEIEPTQRPTEKDDRKSLSHDERRLPYVHHHPSPKENHSAVQNASEKPVSGLPVATENRRLLPPDRLGQPRQKDQQHQEGEEQPQHKVGTLSQSPCAGEKLSEIDQDDSVFVNLQQNEEDNGTPRRILVKSKTPHGGDWSITSRKLLQKTKRSPSKDGPKQQTEDSDEFCLEEIRANSNQYRLAQSLSSINLIRDETLVLRSEDGSGRVPMAIDDIVYSSAEDAVMEEEMERSTRKTINKANVAGAVLRELNSEGCFTSDCNELSNFDPGKKASPESIKGSGSELKWDRGRSDEQQLNPMVEPQRESDLEFSFEELRAKANGYRRTTPSSDFNQMKKGLRPSASNPSTLAVHNGEVSIELAVMDDTTTERNFHNFGSMQGDTASTDLVIEKAGTASTGHSHRYLSLQAADEIARGDDQDFTEDKAYKARRKKAVGVTKFTKLKPLRQGSNANNGRTQDVPGSVSGDVCGEKTDTTVQAGHSPSTGLTVPDTNEKRGNLKEPLIEKLEDASTITGGAPSAAERTMTGWRRTAEHNRAKKVDPPRDIKLILRSASKKASDSTADSFAKENVIPKDRSKNNEVTPSASSTIKEGQEGVDSPAKVLSPKSEAKRRTRRRLVEVAIPDVVPSQSLLTATQGLVDTPMWQPQGIEADSASRSSRIRKAKGIPRVIHAPLIRQPKRKTTSMMRSSTPLADSTENSEKCPSPPRKQPQRKSRTKNQTSSKEWATDNAESTHRPGTTTTLPDEGSLSTAKSAGKARSARRLNRGCVSATQRSRGTESPVNYDVVGETSSVWDFGTSLDRDGGKNDTKSGGDGQDVQFAANSMSSSSKRRRILREQNR